MPASAKAQVIFARALSTEMEHVLAVGLHPSPTHRFKKASDFATALRKAFTGQMTPALRERAVETERNYPWRRLIER